MLIYYAGEDVVTKQIARRIIKYVLPNEELDLVDANPRDYGTRAFSKIDLLYNLSEKSPVICIFDSDAECVVSLLKEHTTNGWKNTHLAINIAIDEGETWLMADQTGFSKYFGIKKEILPKLNKNSSELSNSIPYKTSLYFMLELVPHSNKVKVRDSLTCIKRKQKPPTYNNLWPDYIENHWNIDEAVKNSQSLARTIKRVQKALS